MEDAVATPLAVGAAKLDVPVVGPGLLPVGGVDEVRVALGADVERRPAKGLVGVRLRRLRGGLSAIGEVQNLDRLATRKRHALDGGLLSVVTAIDQCDSLACDIGTVPQGLNPLERGIYVNFE